MFDFQDTMKTFGKSNYCYSFELEKDDPYDHKNGYASERGFALTFNGARHYLNVPPVQDFILTCRLEHNQGFVAKRPLRWGIKFGYDRRTRVGYEIELCRLADKEGTQISLYKTKALEKQLLQSQQYSFVQKADTPYFFRLCLHGEKLDCYFATCYFNATLPPMKGKIAFVKGESFREIFISDLTFKTLELTPLRTYAQRFVLPSDNTPNASPYHLDLTMEDYGAGYQRVTATLGGGLFDDKPEAVIHTQDLWATIYDDFHGLYIRLNDGERLYLFNHTKRILPTQYGDSFDIVREAHDVARAVYDVVDRPFSACFLLSKQSNADFISVGYEKVFEKSADFLATPREYVFDAAGNLRYAGAALDQPFGLDVHSPISQELLARLPEDTYQKDDVITHLTNNHYFTVRENVTFSFDFRSVKNTADYTFNAYLGNAFFKKLRALSVHDGETPRYDFGNPVCKNVDIGNLGIGVYHLIIEIFYAGEKVGEHRSAFDVIDPDKDISPRIASGIPPIHAQDGVTLGMKHCLPDPWLSIPDSNNPHYIEIATYSPFDFEDKRPWELQRLLKRKTLVWATQRNATRQEIMDGKLLESQMIANADYVNYPYPLIHESGNYYRFDFSEERLYFQENGEQAIAPMADILREFLSMHPDIRDELGLQEITPQTLTRETHIAFLKHCHREWLDFAIPKIERALQEQWQEDKQLINTNAKRHSYGPFPQYTSPFVGGYTAKWFGGTPTKWHETFDGFMQYEDYPFVCDYSTTKGAWGMATIKLLCPQVKVYPEIYDGFTETCPDSAIACARPPLGSFDAEPYMSVTQIQEYVYNTARYDGEFAYWNLDGIVMFYVFNYRPQERWETVMKALGNIRENMPRKPKKGVVFVYDIQPCDDRFDGFHYHSFYNISDANMSYVYTTLREHGIPVSHITNFAHLHEITKDNCTALVLPSLEGASEETLSYLRTLHEQGLPLICVSSVGALEDVFGVQVQTEIAPLTSILRDEKEEFVTNLDAEFFHKPQDAEVLLRADNGNAILTKKGNAVSLNASVCQVGRDCVNFIFYNSAGNASALLQETMTNVLLSSIVSPVRAEGKCGITHFETTRGEDCILLVDYTEGNRHAFMDKHQRIVVRLPEEGYLDVVGITDNRSIGKVYENGVLTAFTIELAPQESFLLRCKR